MTKIPMYIILTVAMSLGGYIPTLFGESAFGGWSILGTMTGGFIGIVIYAKLRKSGYLE
ncbi:MAG: hypothetical protein WBB94_00490 [Candidatus Saccharimonadaceae bacterium]